VKWGVGKDKFKNITEVKSLRHKKLRGRFFECKAALDWKNAPTLLHVRIYKCKRFKSLINIYDTQLQQNISNG
jgi:putative NADPH-quinone reductase